MWVERGRREGKRDKGEMGTWMGDERKGRSSVTRIACALGWEVGVGKEMGDVLP